MSDTTTITQQNCSFFLSSEADTKPVLRRRSEASDTSERVPSARQQRQKRWSDLHLTDMVFTNDGVEPKKSTREREPWKRWSDLQLKQDPKLLSQIKVSLDLCLIIIV